MKKITILVITMFATLGAFAQFNQGRMLVGGSAEFRTNTDKTRTGSTTVKNWTQTSLSVAPQFGYFVIDNLAVGAGLEMRVSKWNDKSGPGSDATTTSLHFQPFIRYYLPIGIFFQGKFGVGTSKTTYDENLGDAKYNDLNLSVSAGYAFFLTDNVAVEPELGYRTERV